MKPRVLKFRPRYDGSVVGQLRAALVDAENHGIAEVIIAYKLPSGTWSIRNSLVKNPAEACGALEIMKKEILHGS